MKKHTGVICILALIFVLISNTVPVLAAGSDTKSKTIRVGYMNHPGFIENKDGEFSGYGVEYLDEICKYSGWKIEYRYATWSEQLEMLENGELDIVPLAQYSEERAEKYLYTSQPMGLLQCMLLTLPEGENSIEGNALACNGKRIGILKGSRNIDLLKRYSEHMGFEYDKVEYDSQSDLEQAVLNGEVEIIACEQMVKNTELRVLDRFASDSYYIITDKENMKLMDELNYVMSKMNAYDPTYTSKLYQKYFGKSLSSNRPYFTNEEIEYIKSHPEVTLAVIPDNEPLAYVDKNGEMVGMIPDIMAKLSELSGINFRYEYIPKDVTPLSFMKENPTYLGTGMLATNPTFKEEKMLVSDVYYTTYAALVAHGSDEEEPEYKTGNYTVGVPKSFQAMQLFIKRNYPNLQIKEFLSVEDGLKSLEEGEVDLFAYTISFITPYISNPVYGDIYILNNRFMSCPLCTVGVESSENKLLIGILNKCNSMVYETDIAQLESDYFYQISYHYNDGDVFHRYRGIVIPVMVAVVLIIFALLLFLWLRQRKFNRDITMRSEYDILTGLYNRATTKRKAEQIMEQNNGVGCALILFNIDNLNQINETNGHSVGDEIIKTVADIVKKQFAGSAIAGRVGGDDFVVFLPGIESKSVLVTILTKFQKTVSSTVISNVVASLSISIGVKMFCAGECGSEEAFQCAREAMHRVKSNGKDGFAFYTSQKVIPFGSIYHQLTDDSKATVSNNDEQLYFQETEEAVTGSHTECDSDFRRLVEAFPNVALYVIEEKTHKVLYYNKRFKEICPNITEGMSCRNITVGPCRNCIVDTMGEQKMAHAIYYSDVFGDEVEITATKILWRDSIPAVMISSWPRTVLTSSNDRLPRISNQDSFDYVTGGLTRQGFIHMMERMQNGGVDLTEYAVLFINIQDFKAVNELAGSEGGDNLLRTMFTRIEQSALHPIIGARKESDHFVYLVEKRVLDLDKLSGLLNFHWQYEGKELFILGRCGVFMIEDSQLEIYKMIDRAKLAKDHIVDEYVKPYSVYIPSMLENYSENAEAFLLFDQGIKNNEFLVYYQPVIDAKTEKIVGAEALVRRRTADGAIVSPGKFIPILERTGYISMLDRIVGNEVRRFQIKRAGEQLPIVPISFNLSQKDFYDTELMELLVEGFENNSFPRGAVLLEITESAYTLNEKNHESLLKRLREAGAKILLDDFGTGYSSFGMFENYNFDRVKLDMSFVRQLSKNENVRQVVSSIISMCHNLGVQVVAEGVETADELAILREMDCDYIQGYYFSKPLPEKEFEEYLALHI